MTKKVFNGKAEKDTCIVKNLSDDALLDIVQQQTLKYFTDFAHPVSGMARERSNVVANYGYDLDCVTTGGTGFGIMAIIAGAERGFLDKADALNRITKIVDFLETADTFHGTFPHFLNGNTGKTIPFSPKDDGGDLVETSFLMMGLLAARQYFAALDDAAPLCAKINKMWEAVEWDWYTQGENNLYWHWSPTHNFDMNLPIRGWNECLVTHILAASSPTHPVSTDVYTQSWVKGNDFNNGTAYDGAVGDDKITLPLGPAHGGPLFFAHYSFMGLNPHTLKDEHTNYADQAKAHTLVNRAHCINNPHGHKGYGENCWGLTASDDHGGYDAHSPTNDNGTITPTAALSSFPYTPLESMQALRHFYEEMGDKIWGKYGFVDAFNENHNWQAKSHLAIDQGPIVVMIENHRSGLLWDMFMSCPEIKCGLQNLKLDNPAPQKPAASVTKLKP